MQNAFIERKNGSIRRELLNAYMFKSLSEVRELCEEWRIDYNTERPQKSLGYLPPVIFAEQWYKRSKYAQLLFPQMATENKVRLQHEVPNHIISIEDEIEWQFLMKYLTDLKWRRKYETDILDGIQWELAFKNENEKLNSCGSNAFPSNFSNFTALIEKIRTKHKIPCDIVENYRNYQPTI